MFGPGSGVIRVGDRTTHGGYVIEGIPSMIVHGQQLTCVGKIVMCPIHGVTRIIQGHTTVFYENMQIAFEDCVTSCGAQLISSMNNICCLGDDGVSAVRQSDSPSQPVRPSQFQHRTASSFADTTAEVCEHPDQALDVAAYIVGEIQKNAASEEARIMRALNSSTVESLRLTRERKLENMSLFQRIGERLIKPDLESGVEKARESALVTWTRMVRQRGPWDHKFKIATERGEKLNEIKFSTLGKSSHRWHHKYGEYEYYYDIWSNIHYGYLGVYCGFSADLMLDGAGLEQVGTDLLNPEKDITDNSDLNGPGLRKYDDSTDNLSIRIGIELFGEYPDPSKITAEMVMQKVDAAPYPIRLYSKIAHDCDLVDNREV